nr:MAG TPA: hypothetical protein [Caudoviricetes sp.]
MNLRKEDKKGYSFKYNTNKDLSVTDVTIYYGGVLSAQVFDTGEIKFSKNLPNGLDDDPAMLEVIGYIVDNIVGHKSNFCNMIKKERELYNLNRWGELL